MDESSPDPRVGAVLDGRYRVTQRLAEGAMGVVYRGERIQLGRTVAIKFLRAPFATEPEFLTRFEREARAMSRLSHPHCVSVIDFGVADVPYVVMEFVTGQSLDDVLDRGPVPAERAVAIVRQVLAALAHAHGQDIVHRDIKAANVMLTEATGFGDHVKLLDFGLAKLRDRPSDVSSAHIVVGTPSYMAPEQSLARPADARSDVYSTGILLFELLAGEKPFRADQTVDLLRMHRDEPVPAIAEVCPDAVVAPGLEAVVVKALAKDPDARYQSAIEFAAALDGVTAVGAAQGDDDALPYARTQAMDAEPPPRKAGRRGLGVLVGLALLGGAGALYARIAPDSAEPPPMTRNGDRPAVITAADETPTMVLEADDLADQRDAGGVDGGPRDAALGDAAIADADFLLDDDDAGEESLPPEERDEPVPAVAEEAGEPAVEEAPPEEEQEATMPAPRRVVRTLADVKALLAEGKKAEAIRGLRKLRTEMPRSAYVPYLLGNLYFDRMWWTDGIKSYREAIRRNRVYRKKVTLNKNLIRALGSNKTRGKAAWTFQNLIGRAALPHLRRAAKADKNRLVRLRAANLVKVLSKKRRKRRR